MLESAMEARVERRALHGKRADGRRLGTLMFGKRDERGVEQAGPMDLLRLAIPRRVYTQSHIDYVVEVILEVWRRRAEIQGLEITYQAPFLRHFTARFRPASA